MGDLRRQKKPKEKYLFVNKTNDPDQQDARHRRLVHSHVSQYRWKKNRRAESKAKGKSVSPTEEEEETQHTTAKAMTKSQLTNLLDEGLFDPFQSYSGSFYSTAQAHDALSYAMKSMWPGLLPQSNNGFSWIPKAMADPLLFSACMYGSAVHMQSRRTGSSDGDRRAVMKSANETIRRLNLVLANPVPGRTISDGVILTVLTLAFNWNESPYQLNPDPQPRRPLQDLQWLAMYSGLPVNEVHVGGLGALLAMNGGNLGGQDLPGLPPLLSYSSILLASKELSKPLLPFIPLSKKWTPPEEASILQSEYLLLANTSRHVRKIMTDMYHYNEMLSTYLAGSIEAPEMAAFSDARNWIQHQLLSLPEYEELDLHSETAVTSKAGYDIVRIGLLLYSLIVIFPIPFAHGPFVRLRGMLREILTEQDANHKSDLPKDMLLWVVSLAVIPFVPEGREWFEEMLRKVASQMGLSSWGYAKGVLKSIMWQDSVLDPLIGKLWPSWAPLFQ